jgi:hypothetical protein
MSHFTSRKEKQLWIATAIVLTTIYATLAVSYSVSSYLRDQGLLEATFGIGMVLTATTILLFGVRKGHNMATLGMTSGILAVYMLVLVRIEIPEERSHIIEYSVLAAFIYMALLERKQNGGHMFSPPLIAILATALAGLLDEVLQYMLPERVFDMRDILFNCAAALMAVVSIMTLNWISALTRR